ncbi:MAG: UvrD-helicase domain-containing protein, partial [Planctomycetes bacterium]|nr:UvrD-helicase domain-containing protein [Planctomycetota bacterium]
MAEKKAKRADRPAEASAPPPDQAQRDRILSELDRNLLVEAAAGTGKTTCMVGRMVALLASGRVATRGLAAVTFTRKAAAEMRARFQVELERRARSAAGPERENLARALGTVEQCFLGTIHSFCARLLRERPVEAGVDPAFEELDEEADGRLREEAWREFAAALHAARDPALEALDALGLAPGELETSFARYVEFPDVAEWPSEAVPLPD